MRIIILFIAFTLFGCTDFSRDIDENYRFIKLDSDNHVITIQTDLIVYQDVTKYEYNDKYIVGLREKSKFLTNYFPEVSDAQPFGYFVLEKESGKLSFLDEKEFFEFVRDQQIDW